MWIAAIATVDLMPVPTTVSSVAFSLSFPIELSVALIYPSPVAALIALIGASDPRELRREMPFLEGLFIRAQIAGGGDLRVRGVQDSPVANSLENRAWSASRAGGAARRRLPATA